MFERFTDRARRVVVLAQEEARMLNHSYIGTEHILLGLIHEGEGVAAAALESLGISLGSVREQVQIIIGQGQQAPTGHIPFTPRAKKVLELSLREALQLGHNYIGTEHILLGLIREGEGVAAQVLVRLGADLHRVRQQTVILLGSPVDDEPSVRETSALAATTARFAARRSEREGMTAVMARLAAMEARLAVVEQRVGIGPDLSQLDLEIARARQEKQVAIEAQHFERAAELRDREKRLAADKASRRRAWAATHPDQVSMAEELWNLRREMDRMRLLLREHGIDWPDVGTEGEDAAGPEDGAGAGDGTDFEDGPDAEDSTGESAVQ
jgi:ATP-dependent Clp protease ATP-binding subunit ClpA